jgi:hypothetical protein
MAAPIERTVASPFRAMKSAARGVRFLTNALRCFIALLHDQFFNRRSG